MKKILIVILVLAVAGAGAYFFWQQDDDSGDIKLYGNVDIRQVSLAFTQSERISDMLVEEGDKVIAGQEIARLDDTLQQLQLTQSDAQIAAQQALVDKLHAGSRPQEIAQAEATVKQQIANVDLAKSRLARLVAMDERLNGTGVSDQDIDEAKDNLAALRAGLEQAQANLALVKEGPRKEDITQAEAQLAALQAQAAELKEQLKRTVLRAPSDAVVRARLLEQGDLASPQKPVVTLALITTKWIRVYINETQLASVAVGDRASVHVDGIANQLSGTVSFVSSVAEFTPKNVETEDLRTSLVYEVRLRVDDKQNQLKLGMPATVTFANGQVQHDK